FPARPNTEVVVTSERPVDLLRAGHANIGEFTLVGVQENPVDTFVETMQREASWMGGERVRVEQTVDFEELGYVEDMGDCTLEKQVDRSVEYQSTEYGKYGRSVKTETLKWSTTECAARADGVASI